MSKIQHRQIADAYLKIAAADHYLVGFIGDITMNELTGAQAILINISNEFNNANETIERALDLIDSKIKEMMYAESKEIMRVKK
jgi:hypothetical protein